MRRKDREMTKEFALTIVDKCEWAVLAMTDRDTPYCVPISIVREGESIFFHAAQAGKKTDLLRKNPQVCLTCVGDTERQKDDFTTKFESAIVFGTASEVTDDKEKIQALRILCERHTPTNMPAFDEAIERSLHRTAVWKISIDEVTGKAKAGI